MKVSRSGKKKIETMKKMERGIEKLEIIGKPTATGLKLEDKSKKMRKIAIRRWKIDWKLWTNTTGNKAKTECKKASLEDGKKEE